MRNLRVGDIVIAPTGFHRYMTQDKEYVVVEPPKGQQMFRNSEIGFWIKNDYNLFAYCLVNGCAHLQDGTNWIIKERE